MQTVDSGALRKESGSSLQHFCKYACQCVLIKTSRDAVYDHQVGKGGSEEHGGPRRRIYCIDEATYPEFCETLGWDDPPAFGETKPTRTGKQKSTEAAGTSSAKKSVNSHLGKQHINESTPSRKQKRLPSP